MVLPGTPDNLTPEKKRERLIKILIVLVCMVGVIPLIGLLLVNLI
jgi:flagellar basal body-associated protein FliL